MRYKIKILMSFSSLLAKHVNQKFVTVGLDFFKQTKYLDVMCSTPKIGTDSPPSAPLDTIHEAETPTHAGAKRLPPPTLPKPKARPLPPPKPKKSVPEINGSGEMFQVRF